MQQLFLHDISKTADRVIAMIGVKGSGKTFQMLSLIKYFLENNIYCEYHLILPSFRHEQKDQYAFLTKYKSNVFIYSHYIDEIAEELLEKQIKSKNKKKILLAIDDATHMSEEMTKPHLSEIATTSRHCRITLILCLHAARRIMQTSLRYNLDYIFMFRISNDKLLEGLYEENFSSMVEDFENYRDFKSYFYSVINQKVSGEKKNALFLSLNLQKYDPMVCNWKQY